MSDDGILQRQRRFKKARSQFRPQQTDQISAPIVFGEKFLWLWDWQYWLNLVFYGGRGSGKSFHITLFLVLMCGAVKLNVACIRQYMTTIKESSHADLVEHIERLGLEDQWRVTESELIHKVTGSRITFFGVDGRTRHNIRSQLSRIDIAFLEEAQAFTEEALRTIFNTLRKAGTARAIVSFNVINEDTPIDVWFRKSPRNKTKLIHVGIDDNPYFHQSERMREEYYYAKKFNHEYWLNDWCGEYLTHLSEQIIKFEVGVIAPEIVAQFQSHIGIDIALSENEPTHGLLSYYMKPLRVIYIEHEAVRYGMPIQRQHELLDALLRHGDDGTTITADTGGVGAGVCRIWEDQGYSIIDGKTGTRESISVVLGLQHIASMRVVIHPRCVETIKQFRAYVWKKEGTRILNVPKENGNDHGADALRYSIKGIRSIERLQHHQSEPTNSTRFWG